MSVAKNQIPKLLALLLLFCLKPLAGQQYEKGAIFDPVRYEQTNAKPTLHSRSYRNIARSVSLKRYGPVPGSQIGESCGGWAIAYAARTISESVALNRINREQILSNVFSPMYLYVNVTKEPIGKNGVILDDALSFMKKPERGDPPAFKGKYRGIVKRLPSEEKMEIKDFNPSIYRNAKRFYISSYTRLFQHSNGPGAISEMIPPIKMSLANSKPVIICMNTPESFGKTKGDIWQPKESPNKDHGYHALCVVSYDDDKYGGAFEVQNSWGTEWGNGGYIWISYRDFAAYVRGAWAYDIDDPGGREGAAEYSASIQIEVDRDKRGMPVVFDRQGYYKTIESYSSGAEFRFLMTNRHPAYVYAFSADSNTPGTERIFPLRGVSAALDYPDSTIAWPGEHDWIRLDSVKGTDYLIVLFSREPLDDISAIERRFAIERGGFPERVARAVGANFIPYNQVEYDANGMKFSVASTNPRAVFGLLLAIDHR